MLRARDLRRARRHAAAQVPGPARRQPPPARDRRARARRGGGRHRRRGPGAAGAPAPAGGRASICSSCRPGWSSRASSRSTAPRRELERGDRLPPPARLEPLLSFYTSPGFSTELHPHLRGHRAAPGAASPGDEEEEIELVRMPLEAAIEQVLNGEISDAKTVAGLLAYGAAVAARVGSDAPYRASETRATRADRAAPTSSGARGCRAGARPSRAAAETGWPRRGRRPSMASTTMRLPPALAMIPWPL